jgi:flagellar hook-associated protein 2
MHRINNVMNDFVRTNGTQSRTLRDIEGSIRRVNDQIDRMQKRMFAEEDRLYRQFAAMETALSKIQSQGDWLSAMLGNAPSSR